MLKIVNIVATVTLPHSLDLQKLQFTLPETESSSKVHWLKMRLQPEGTYIAFYKSGKFLVTGKSFEEITNNTNRVIALLKKVNITVDPWQLKVHNIVLSDQIEMETSIENLMYSLDPKKASYEPEQFPALVYKDWGVSILLFNSGKTIISGVKEEARAQEIMNKFRNLVTVQ